MTQPEVPGRIGRAASRLGYLLGRFTPPIFVLMAGVAFWEWACDALRINPGVVPPPTLIAHALVAKSELYLDSGSFTLVEALVGFVAGTSFGIAAAIAIVYSPFLQRVVYPLIITSQMIPTIALAPLLVIWLGFGIEPRIIIITLWVFFPITVNMATGLRSVDPGIIDLMRSYSASRFRIFRDVRLPASLPYLMTAAQISITFSVIGAVAAEWVGASKGLGKLMLTSASAFSLEVTYGAVVIASTTSIVLFALIRVARRFVVPWERVAPKR